MYPALKRLIPLDFLLKILFLPLCILLLLLLFLIVSPNQFPLPIAIILPLPFSPLAYAIFQKLYIKMGAKRTNFQIKMNQSGILLVSFLVLWHFVFLLFPNEGYLIISIFSLFVKINF
jgi:hypothetical protein